jgi:hypothetical protein
MNQQGDTNSRKRPAMQFFLTFGSFTQPIANKRLKRPLFLCAITCGDFTTLLFSRMVFFWVLQNSYTQNKIILLAK